MSNYITYDDIFSKAWDLSFNKAITTQQAARRQAGTNIYGRKGLDLDRKKVVDSDGEAAKFADSLGNTTPTTTNENQTNDTKSKTGPYNNMSARSRLQNLQDSGGDSSADPRIGARMSRTMRDAGQEIGKVVDKTKAKASNLFDESGKAVGAVGQGLRDINDTATDYAQRGVKGLKNTGTSLMNTGTSLMNTARNNTPGMINAANNLKNQAVGGIKNQFSNMVGAGKAVAGGSVGSHVRGQGIMNNVKNLGTGLISQGLKGNNEGTGLKGALIAGQNKRGNITNDNSNTRRARQDDNLQAERSQNMFNRGGAQSVISPNYDGSGLPTINASNNAAPPTVDPNAAPPTVNPNAVPTPVDPNAASTPAPAGSFGGDSGFGNANMNPNQGGPNQGGQTVTNPPAPMSQNERAKKIQLDEAEKMKNTKGGIGTGLLSNVLTGGMSGIARGAYNASQRKTGRETIANLAKHFEMQKIRSSLSKEQFDRRVTPGDRDGNGILDTEERKQTTKLNPDGTIASKVVTLTQKTPTPEKPKENIQDPNDMRMDSDKVDKGFKDVLDNYRKKKLMRLVDRRRNIDQGHDLLRPNRLQRTDDEDYFDNLRFINNNRKLYDKVEPDYMRQLAERGNPVERQIKDMNQAWNNEKARREGEQPESFNPDDAIQNSEPWNVVENPFANPFYNTNAFAITKEPNHAINESAIIDDFLKADVSEPEVNLTGFDTNDGDDLSLLPASVFAKADTPVADNMSLLPTGWKQ